ncbi:MAG: glycosyltransferase family 39 protein [Candidatus Krumholzibacteriota bacterium]|nr:glycosyltransferase family 39 protein [Candidatus Krumholzibacteriota bacterium]
MSRRELGVLFVCALLFASMVASLGGVLVDDTYIHLVYARNLAEAGELSFNRGEPSYGATSPLWVALLAIAHAAGGNDLLWCRVLSIVFGLLSVGLVWSTVRRLSNVPAAAAAAAAVVAADAWLVRWSAVGMETSFAVFMTLLFLRGSIDLLCTNRQSMLLGFILFLAVLARPETILLAPLAVVAFAFERGPRGPRWLWLAVFAVLYGAWLILIRAHTGTFLPLTAGAKQGRPVVSAALFGRMLVPVKILGATGAIAWLVFFAAAAAGIRRGRSIDALFLPAGKRGRGAVVLMLFWVVALPAVYVLFDFHILSRYLLPVAPVVAILAATGASRLFAGIPASTARLVGGALVLAAVAQGIVFHVAVVAGPTRAFSRGLEETIAGAGRWLAANSPPGAVVAAPDIGAVGWYSGRYILDLGGLVSPEINRMRRRIDVERIVEEGLYLDLGCDYLLDRHETPARFENRTIRGVRFVSVFRGEVSNLGIRKPEPVVYVLYRLERGGG